MILRRRVAAGALAALLGVAGIACSGDDSESLPSTTSAAPSTTESSPSTTQPSASSTTEPPTTTSPLPIAAPAGGEVFTDPERDVRELAVDPDGRIWAVGRGGAARVDPSTEEVEVLTTADGLPSSEVTGVAIDDVGVVWLGTAGGLASVRGDDLIDHGAPPVSEEITNPEPRISGVTIGPEGAVWAYHAPNLVRFDGRTWEVVARVGGLGVFDAPTDIVFGPDGTVWMLGAGPDGLTRVQGSAAESVSAPFVVNDLAVAPDGSVWVTAFLGGVARLTDGEWTVWELGDGIPGELVAGVTVADDGTPWMLTGDLAGPGEGAGEAGPATLYTGVVLAWEFDGTEWTVVHTYEEPDFDPSDIQQGRLQAGWPLVFVDGDLWATAGAGLFGWVDGEYVTQPLRTSLDGTRIESVDIADDGTVWVLTDRAVNRYDGTGWAALPHEGFAAEIAAVSGTEAWAAISRDDGGWAGIIVSQLTHVVDDDVEIIEDPESSSPEWSRIADLDLGLDGTVWLATDNGPARLADGVVVYDDVPLVSRATDDIEVADDGTVWASAAGQILSLGPDGWAVQASGEFWSGGLHVTDDAVWTGGGNLGRFDLTSRTWTTWDTVPGYEFLNVTAIAEGLDGTMLAGVFGAIGFFDIPQSPGGVLALRGDSWVGVEHPAIDPSTSVTDVDVGPDGSLWVGTWTGLVHLPPDEL